MTTGAPTIFTADGTEGTLRHDEAIEEGRVVVAFGSRSFVLAGELLKRDRSGHYRLPFTLEELTAGTAREWVLPLAEERLEVGKRRAERRVEVNKVVRGWTETVEVPLEHTEVDVRRVEIGRPLEAPIGSRTEGDTHIVPVLREELVVSKRLVLEAEIHITRRRVSETHTETVTLREEDVEVERTETEP